MIANLEKRIKRQIIGKTHRFLAVAPLGFENTLVQELEGILQQTFNGREDLSPGATIQNGYKKPLVTDHGKVEFVAKITDAWKAVAYSRIANRILMEIGNFKAENFGQLEKHCAEIPWELFLDERRETREERRETRDERRETRDERREASDERRETRDERRDQEKSHPEAKPKDPCAIFASSAGLVLHVTCKHSRLYHSDAVKERVQKVIQNYFNKLSSNNSNTEQGDPAGETQSRDKSVQNLYISFVDDRCTIWLDLAGEELYKRGHDRFVAEAPLKETIAAAMIFEAVNLQIGSAHAQQVVPHQSLPTSYFLLPTIIDPMAGSGTFSLEAAYIANGLIPGKCRDFALKHQPAFKEATWRFLLDERREKRDERDAGIYVDERREKRDERGAGINVDERRVTRDERGAGIYVDERRETREACVADRDSFDCFAQGLAMTSKPSAATMFTSTLPRRSSQACRAMTDERIAENGCAEPDLCSHSSCAFNPCIITSDISQRPIDIIRHNVESSPLREIYKSAPNSNVARINPKLKDFFSYTLEDFFPEFFACKTANQNCETAKPNREATSTAAQSLSEYPNAEPNGMQASQAQSLSENSSAEPNGMQASQAQSLSENPKEEPAEEKAIPPQSPSAIILLNPPYGKRLDCDAPKLYTRIGQKLTEWGREAKKRRISLTVAILAPKDDTRNGSRYTCTGNLLQTCPTLDPKVNSLAKIIETSHGGFSLNAIFAKI